MIPSMIMNAPHMFKKSEFSPICPLFLARYAVVLKIQCYVHKGMFRHALGYFLRHIYNHSKKYHKK